MTNDVHVKFSLWPIDGTTSASDTDILGDMIDRLPLVDDTPQTSDAIYSSFVEAKKASDGWIKYYMISVVLLITYRYDEMAKHRPETSQSAGFPSGS